MFEDFESENCVYLEFRTTPKSTKFLSKQEYVNTITDSIKSYSGHMKIGLILSINRGQSVEEAWGNFELAKSCEFCVGIDFSGNPLAKKFRDFREVMQKAREYGFKITVHTAELKDDEDTWEILNFKPDRLGHCNYLTQECENFIIEHKIPIEICPSSNMATLGISDMIFHHFGKFHRVNHPISICTDDILLFNTTLTKEFEIVAQAYALDYSQICEILQNTAKMAFSSNILDLLNLN